MRTGTESAAETPEPPYLALSWPEEDEGSRRAATRLLDASDVDAQLDGLYPKLLDHKTFLITAAHLEHAGGDLEQLTVSADLVRTLWPFNALFPTPEQSLPGRVPVAAIARRLATHRDHLRRLLLELLDPEPARFMLLFGGSIRATYPSYRHGFSHDLDIFAPDLATGLTILDDLWRLGFALVRLRTSRADRARVAHFKLFRLTADGHRLYVDLIAGGRPSGPRRAPPWMHPPIWERARAVPIEGRTALVPSLEDMLLLASEKTRRKADFSRRQHNDVRFLLRHGGRPIDWDYLERSLERHAVGSAFHRLARDAGEREGSSPVPAEVLRHLEPGGREHRIVEALSAPDLALAAGRGASGPGARGEHGRLLKAWTKGWMRAYLRRRARHPMVILHLLSARAGALLLKLEVAVARGGLERRLGRLGKRARSVTIVTLSKPADEERRRPVAEPESE